jgi:hypothetical protein
MPAMMPMKKSSTPVKSVIELTVALEAARGPEQSRLH